MHSVAYQTAVQREYQEWATSSLAKEWALDKCRELRDTIGVLAYSLWWADLPEPKDWQDLYFMARERLENPPAQECTCDQAPDRERMACPACRARIDNEQIPY